MKNLYKASFAAVLLVLLSATIVFGQTTISGKVSGADGPLPGVNVIVKGSIAGANSDVNGNFSFTTKSALPLTIVVSLVGYTSIELEITEGNSTGLDLKLEEDTNVLQEVVIGGGGIMNNIELTKASFAVEKVGILGLQASPTAEVFDVLQHQKGVQFTSGSLNFNQVNTRGFATIANVRFVQMVDGMDVSAPLLNFPTGNIVGIGELDLESMELLPGTSSGIYGPNAFNGLLLMNSKSPFEYQGLSAQFKGGITTSDAQGDSYPLFNYGIRYAKAFNNKFAFKVNFNIMQGEDWYGTDYRTDVARPDSKIDLTGQPNFDGLNLYGDETKILVPLPAPFSALNDGEPLDLRRTGWEEGGLLDNKDAESIKADVALHYKVTDNLEAIYNYRYGGGSSVYQGSQKYALRDFTQQFHKLELRSKNFFVRGYITATDAGDSYNMGALGGQLNERISPTREQWAPTYAQTWILAMQGAFIGQGIPANNKEAAHAYARQAADAGRAQLIANPAALQDSIESVRNDYFQRNPAGAKFIDQSRLYHAQFNYNFADLIKFAEIMVGGNFRQYSLFSDGTIFNEDPETGTDFQRIKINEYGVYTQISKEFSEAFKLIASLRYDKNENFKGQTTPRISGVYSFGSNKQHNLRASYQTGFRNPDTQAQYIYFPVGTNTLIGSTKDNAERYGIFNGGSWTRDSYDAGEPVTANIDYVQPEKLSSFEVGYRGTIGQSLFLDLNGYWNTYTDFQGSLDVVSKNPTTHQGEPIPAGTVFSPYVNVDEKVTSNGIGAGITYKPFPAKDYVVTGSYSFARFDLDKDSEYRTGFNTPENKITIGIANRRVWKDLGFSLNYRWQEAFLWESDFGIWEVPEFGVFDAQVSYKISSIKTMLKIGGQNIGGGDYRTNFGGPFVGQQYYISLTFDQFMK
ncbi:MAG TPA: TonB-dependent receptor [Ohtaekwangia sp.]